MSDLNTLAKLLQNPRIAHKESIPVIPIEKKNKIISLVAGELPPVVDLTPIEYIKSVKNSQLTTLLDKNGLPYIIDNGALMVVKCANDHIHKLPTREVADGAKCPTCTRGTGFSRKMVKYIKEEFNITILYHTDKPELEYNNPVLKLKIIITSKCDSFEKKDDTLTIYINPKPKNNMLDYLRNVLVIHGIIQTQSHKKIIPITTDGFNRFVNHTTIDINNLTIIDDPLMLFENC